VFRPFEFEDPLPVMVWIHGGTFVAGTASDPLFDGSKLAQAGVIVVTLNYRLGAFGWLALADGASDDSVSNLGMLDQIAALRWVHDNIAAFGGDPNNVTLFGTSSGAMSVALLMLCEGSRALFQKAILQSVPGRDRMRAMDEAEAVGKEFLRAVASGPDGADPRAAGFDVLMAAEKLLLAKSARSFGPVKDGVLVTQGVAAGFQAGRQSRIPLIIGSNDDETTFGAAPDVNAELRLAGDAEGAAPRLYPEVSDNPAALAARLYTDRVFTEPARVLARSHVASGAATYRYRFAYVPEAQRGDSDAGHGRELPFVFGTDGVPGAGLLMRRDREVGNLLRAYWTNFARTGDPNGSGLPPWDATSHRDRLLLIGNERIASGDDPWTERLDRLERRSQKE
jgi:para-nitrobenzyl esterase